MEWATIEGIFGTYLVNTPLLKAVLTFGKIAQDLVQEYFEYYQRWKSHDLFVSLFLFLPIPSRFWVFFFLLHVIAISCYVNFEDCLLAFCCALLRRSYLCLVSVSFTLFRKLKIETRLSLCLLSGLNKSSFLSFLSYIMCFTRTMELFCL